MKRFKFAEESLSLAFALGNVKIIIRSTWLYRANNPQCQVHFANNVTIAVNRSLTLAS